MAWSTNAPSKSIHAWRRRATLSQELYRPVLVSTIGSKSSDRYPHSQATQRCHIETFCPELQILQSVKHHIHNYGPPCSFTIIVLLYLTLID